MTNACIVGVMTLLTKLLLNVRLRRPLQKSYTLTELIIVRSPLPLRKLLFGISPISKETEVINKFI